MSKYHKIISAFAILILGLLWTSCEKEVAEANVKREKTVTFILSADIPGKQYFQLAEEYFRKHPEGATDIVTSECRSIACVIDYLNEYGGEDHWAKVNLVAHGNSKTGLNLYLSDGGHKATPKRMVQEVALNNLPSLSSRSVDSSTIIDVMACGIGTNPMIALSMKSVFKTDGLSWPTVNCSDKFVVFRTDTNGVVQKVEAQYWPYYYKRGYRPSVSEIDDVMNERYPKDSVLWDGLLSNPTDDDMTMEYHIPISYTQLYEKKSDRPTFTNQQSKEQWAKSQRSIAEKLVEINMDFEQFHWRVDKRIIKDADGKYQYAVKAIGMTTSICFLKVLDS